MNLLIFPKSFNLIFIFFFILCLSGLSQSVEESLFHLKGSVHGEIIDDQTKAAVPFVTISIIKVQDSSLVTGNISDENGLFEIDKIPEGEYIARLNALGYKTLNTSNFSIAKGNHKIQLGKLILVTDAKVMDEVVVQGEKALMQNGIDKKVYNTEKMGTTQGATAVEILENVPSVNVDVDGNASLRGGGVIILIDGRPSGLSGGSRSAVLDQIPASSIERVEVITNPSAKYDPDGTTGIINIILKKNNKLGYNGSVSLSVGNRNKYNGSANFNIRKNKINFFSNYTYRNTDYYGLGSSNRASFLPDTTFYLRQQNNSGNINVSHLLKTGIDYKLNDQNSIGFSGTVNVRKRDGFENINYFAYDANEIQSGNFARNNTRDNNGNSFDINSNYIRTFKKEGENLTVDLNYSKGIDNNYLTIFQQGFLNGLDILNDTSITQENNTTGNNYFYSGQTDYIKPVGKSGKLELGTKAQVRNTDRDFAFNNYNNIGNYFENDVLRSNRFAYTESLYSLYGSYSIYLGNLGYQAGVRAEQALTESNQRTTNQTFKYNYFNLFPSAYLSYKIKEINEFRINYSRRIDRPDFWNLNPFIDYSDRFNIRSGNPYLRPEYINSYELSHVITKDKWSFSSTLYYRQTNNMIFRYRTMNTEGVTLLTFQNLAKAQSTGLELIADLNMLKWWKLNTSFNFYQRKVDAGNVAEGLNNQNQSWNVKALSNWKIRWGMDAQLSYNYQAPNITPQGIMLPMHSLDVSLKKDVLKGKGNISVRVSDIFNTRRFAIKTEGSNFSDEFMRKRETRVIFASFSYRFGSIDNGNKKGSKKQNNRDDNNGSGGGDDMQ